MTDPELNSLYRYAFSLTQDDDWAHDLVSFAIEKILLRPWVRKKHAYVRRTIRNKFYDEYKRSLRLEPIGDVELGLDSLEDIYIRKNELEVLLRSVDPRERELLYLWAVEEYSLEEIANLWDVPKGTLCSKIYRLRRKLVGSGEEKAHEG